MKSSLSSRLQTLYRSLKQRYQESLRIALQSRHVGFKTALLQEARVVKYNSHGVSLSSLQSSFEKNKTVIAPINQTAVSFLRAEQQWSLLRYHGVLDYGRILWAQRRRNATLQHPKLFYSTSDTGNEQQSSSASASSTSSSKIAVMITNRMRQTLIHDLNYHDKEQISKLTPLQASLILKHELRAPPLLAAASVQQDAVTTNENDEEIAQFQHRLADLEREHYEQQERERQAAQRVAAAAVLQENDASLSATIHTDEPKETMEQNDSFSTKTNVMEAETDSRNSSTSTAKQHDANTNTTQSPETQQTTRSMSPFSFLSTSASRNLLDTPKTTTAPEESSRPAENNSSVQSNAALVTKPTE
jgi:hypothetical protein